jgi:hypothetical protein
MAIYLNNNRVVKNVSKDIELSINFFNNNVLTNINEYIYFKNRYVNINSDSISIGKSKNELDNGYYDLCLKVKAKYIEIRVNKLFKEFNKDIICDEIYVNELIEYIIRIFILKIDEKLFSDLIITNYELIRDIDRNNVYNVDKVVEINDINIVISVWQNMLLLKMGDK